MCDGLALHGRMLSGKFKFAVIERCLQRPITDTQLRTTRESVQDRPISAILLDDKDAFKNAVETMQNDDSRSFKVRFSVLVGLKSKLARDPAAAALASEEEAFPMEGVREEENILTLEGQGILIYDKTSGEASHVSTITESECLDYH